MIPIIKRLQNSFADQSFGIEDKNPLRWAFSEKIKTLDLKVYKELVGSHFVYQLEYSLLGQQIRTHVLGKPIAKEQLIEQLVAAIFLADLLSHMYQHYLLVPREVERLAVQRQKYHELLEKISGEAPFSVAHKRQNNQEITQTVRNTTANINGYRLVFVRAKRALDIIAAADFSADWFHRFVGHVDRVLDPFLVHLAWFYFVPRMTANLALLLKHTIPGPWMHKPEKDLQWWERFSAHLQRRWFELGNDVVWVGLGLAQCFILVGAFAPLTIYFLVTFFAYDVLLSAGRMAIELNRLYSLRDQYQAMLNDDSVDKNQIEGALQAIKNQIKFDTLRLGTHLLSTIGICLSFACALPAVAVCPILPVIGAVCLVLIGIINLAMIPVLHSKRPIDEPSQVEINRFQLFAPSLKKQETTEDDVTPVPNPI